MSPKAPPRPGTDCSPRCHIYCSRDCKLPEDKNCAHVRWGPPGAGSEQGFSKGRVPGLFLGAAPRSNLSPPKDKVQPTGGKGRESIFQTEGA